MKYFLLILFLLLSGCSKKTEPINPIEDKEEIEKIEETEVKYIDNNPIKLSLYRNNNGILEKVNTYTSKWQKLNEIIVLSTVYSEDDNLYGYYFQDIFNEYYNTYEIIQEYKIGYHVSFDLEDGSKIDKTILSPKDNDVIKCFIELFLYDDINQEKGAWYRHVEENEVTENTIFTSVKVFASTYYDQISSPITLTAFTYKKDDLDESNNYKGNSKYTIILEDKASN